MHGGAKGSGAPFGNQNALKHGRYTREHLQFELEGTALMKQIIELRRPIDDL